MAGKGTSQVDIGEDSLLKHSVDLKLRLVDPADFSIHRRVYGKGFIYLKGGRRSLKGSPVLERLKSLAVPPAWQDVRFCDDENGHIQATGRDDQARLQYRYHGRWEEVRDRIKAERLLIFGRSLPKIRAAVRKDLMRRQPDRRFVAAMATAIIDKKLTRPGHEQYAADGGLGVTTLRSSNLRIVKGKAILAYVGKSGQSHRIEITDRGLVRRLERLRRLPGKRLFTFRDKSGAIGKLTASGLNEYLRRINGRGAAARRVSAKDFRTFRGSAIALGALAIEDAATEAEKKKALTRTMRMVSEILRNTPAVARSSYVHPIVTEAFEDGELSAEMLTRRSRTALSPEESALMRLLEEKVEL